MAKARLGNILIEAGEITAAQLDAALEEQRESGRPLGMTLVHQGAIDENTLIRTLAKQLSLPMARLSGKRISREVRDLVPFDLAEKHRCCPLFVKEENGERTLFLGMVDASDADAISDVTERVGLPVRPVLVAPSEIEESLHRQYDMLAAGSPPPLGVGGDDAPEGGTAPDEPALSPPEDDPLLGMDGPEGDGPEEAGLERDGFEEDGLEEDAPEEDGEVAPDPAEVSFGAAEDALSLSDDGLDLDAGADADEPPEAPSSEPESAGDGGSEAQLDLAGGIDEDPLGDSLGDFAAELPSLETDADGPGAPEPPRPGAISPDAILRALSQLLVEKGVISREEFIDRVHRESEKDG